MITVNRSEYHNLRNFLVSSSTGNIYNLKSMYKTEINSIRMLNRINNIKDLIEILEKRVSISENDITILVAIAKQIRNTEFLTYYNSINSRDAAPVSEPIISNHNLNSGRTDDVNRKIHEYICKSIGNKWIDLARAIEITESEIDDIRMRHDTDCKSCANEVLLLYKTNTHPRNWRLLLLEGLITARRNDVRGAVEKILNDAEI